MPNIYRLDLDGFEFHGVKQMTNLFTPDAFHEVDQMSKEASYQTIVEGGTTYEGIASVPQTLQLLTTEVLQKQFNFTIRPNFFFFRKYEKDQKAETFVHTDQSFGQLLAIISLSEHTEWYIGTALWSHNETLAHYNEPNDLNATTYQTDGTDVNRWTREDLIEHKPNHGLVLPTNRFHSRFPKVWNFDEPRRILTVFFSALPSYVNLKPMGDTDGTTTQAQAQ